MTSQGRQRVAELQTELQRIFDDLDVRPELVPALQARVNSERFRKRQQRRARGEFWTTGGWPK